MKVSEKARKMLMHHEGVRFRPYRCPAALWTVGVGHVIDPAHIGVKFEDRKNLPIPEGWDRKLGMAEVESILEEDLRRFERGVERLCPSGLNQRRFDALVSFAFNVGLGALQRSSIRARHNRGDYQGASEAFMMWTKAAGKVMPGLVRRREDERNLYLGR